MKRVSVVGLGYIGLPTAIIAAQAGYEVYGFDIDQEKVHLINQGKPAFFEPELSERLTKVLKTGNLKVSTEIQYADCFLIAVPTPFKNDKTADLQYVYSAAESIAKRLMPGNIVILESTVPVGTTERLALFLEENSGLKLGMDFFIAYCPERVLPGKIFKELTENDRVVGGICQRSCEKARLFYAKFVKGFLHITDDKTAEMVKLIENAHRDVEIAFAHQVASMCNHAGIDPYHTIELANRHPRVKILNPTCGVGGHCIAVDPWFLVESFPEETQLLKTARTINDKRPYQVIAQLLHKVEELQSLGTEKPKVLALGIAFKPDVDDIRQSPALNIALDLNNKKDAIEFQVYDHNISREVMTNLGLTYPLDLWKGLKWADIILVLVKHKEFTLIREEAFGSKVLVDTCGLLHEMHRNQSCALLEGATRTALGHEIDLDNKIF
jgi:UDP-N-acetyl-D-mannosaminuronic acid dehydrogenase